MKTLFAADALERETSRLYEALHHVGWTREECSLHAPLTLEILERKESRRATILAHSYQTPDILYGVADYRGDSLGLSQEARRTDADVIVFCGVRFMAETAKILSPEKTVLLPAPDAGCSLSESITGQDVRALRAEHPDAAVVCYVNTSAEVKAESDVCCTSANALKVVESLPQAKIIFLPDVFMAKNLQPLTDKRIIPWRGTCIVHETFNAEKIRAHQQHYAGLKVLVHTECAPEVVREADLAGGTGDMIRYIRESPAKRFMLVTECGMSDRMKVEFPDREFVGTCVLCPYMKKIDLRNILQVLRDPRPDQVIELDEDVRVRAKRAIDRMLELA